MKLIGLLCCVGSLYLVAGNGVPKPCGQCECYLEHFNLYADCHRKGLHDVPQEVPNDTFWLDLSWNKFDKLVNFTFDRFTKLQYLNLSYNIIGNASMASFVGLGSLKFLHLQNNRLHYGLFNNSEIFTPLKQLTFLDISSNNFIVFEAFTKYPDKALSYLENLEVLYMDGLPEKNLGPGFSIMKRLVEINLSGKCSIIKLTNETFYHVKHISVLILRDCHISHIHPGSLSQLKNLTFIDISLNKGLQMAGIRNLTYELRNLPIRFLYMNDVVMEYAVCVVLKDEFILNLNNTLLEVFSADHNFIEKFGDNALSYFPKTLNSMSVRENKFTFGPYIKDIQLLTGLEKIDLSGRHRAHEFPHFHSTLLEQSKMTTSGNSEDCDESCYTQTISSIPTPPLTLMDDVTIPVPPNLKNVTYSYSQLPYHIGKMKIENNTLQKVDVSSNILSTWSGPVTGLEKLKHLDLSNNLAKHIWPEFFHTFPGLEILNVSDNFMGIGLYNDTNGTVFVNQNNLRVLDLRSNYINRLNKMVFKGLYSLEILNLQDNSIHPDFAVDINHIKNLKSINLQNNQVRWFDINVINALNILGKIHNVEINLSKNPIACTCYNLDFLSWMNDPKSNITFVNVKEYFCMYSSGKNQSLADLQAVYDDLNNSCHTYFGLALGLVAAFVLILSIIAVGAAYRYRWKLRYLYYAARLKYSKLTEKADDGNFEYDAFLSFAEEDRDFVVNELREKLECDAGLTLNLHQRNFRPGRPIASNIVDAVKNSRRTLIILSKYFLDSYWCRYELEMGKMESFNTGRDVLVIVMLEQIPPKEIPPEIQCHLQEESYLEYPQEGDSDVFWRTLIDSLTR